MMLGSICSKRGIIGVKVLNYPWLYCCHGNISYVVRRYATRYNSAAYTVATPPGEKKDISCPLPKVYSPCFTEAAWYDWWTKEGFFTPEYHKKKQSTKKFVMCLPPPNVTGTLHLGHALTNSIQDAIVRWHRMNGAETLWIPGCDHAGIATQVVVEKKLKLEEGLSRQQIGRGKFVEEIQKWKTDKEETIYKQMKRLGSSLDWNRSCFTMDQKMCDAVTEAFIQLYEEGLIHRSNRMINWSCDLQSVISDIEVENVQIFRPTMFKIPGYDSPVELGKITSFAYPVENSDEVVVVSTTRPETMLGDTAVAVHPDDPRFSQLHGKMLRHPLEKRSIPIICDESVDMLFGTGAVKITPAHDHKDFALGQRHDLPTLSVIDKYGNMQNVHEEFVGMKRFDAREAVIDKLQKLSLFKETLSHQMVVPICSRSKDIIEPMVMDQWFLHCQQMTAQAIEVVKLKDLKLYPSYYEKIWNEFMINTKEWCISRQLWWGHQIPAYRAWMPSQTEDEGIWVVGKNAEDARSRAEKELGCSAKDINLRQDEDVLDTWFSSALFPFSSLGWPKPTADLQRYYPGSLLETGNDILFFWVARMVMLGLKLTDQLPFSEVVLHGLLRDANGRKMSKSLGNVIDPLDVVDGITLEELHKKVQSSNLDLAEEERAIDGQREDFPQGIPECGTDALRFTLCCNNYKDQTINLDITQAESYRKFCNKIWQSFFYVQDSFGAFLKPTGHIKSCDLINQWILSRLYQMTEQCDQYFKTYDLHLVCRTLHPFWLTDFCSLYLEYSKYVLENGSKEEKECVRQILYVCMDTFLRAISPFMPYLSEELYQRLPRDPDRAPPSVCVAPYPSVTELPLPNSDLEDEIAKAKLICSTIMRTRNMYRLKSNVLPVYVHCKTDRCFAILSHQSTTNMMRFLSRSKSLDVLNAEAGVPRFCIKKVVHPDVDVYVMMKDLCDPEQEIQSIVRRIEKVEKTIKDMERRKSGGDVKGRNPVFETKLEKLKEERQSWYEEMDGLKTLIQDKERL